MRLRLFVTRSLIIVKAKMMIKNFFDRMLGLKMSIVSGILLLVSFILMLTKTQVIIDPAWATVAISGVPLLYYAMVNLVFKKKITSPLLISIAMIASITIGELFAAGEVAFIMAIGGLLEEFTIERAKKGIGKLMTLAPQQGRRLSESGEEIIPVEQIQKDDAIRVLPGETIPVDGEIITGEATIDQSVMTGESLPVDKATGDTVYCGTITHCGSIDIRATQVGKDSSLQKMIDMVKEAENKKAPTQRIVDKWASWLVPIALLIAVVTYFATGDIVRAVTVLVVFCPCALALATPTTIVAAIGQATKRGVLIKSGEALEKMGKVNCIAFDKTGTLTHGSLKVSSIVPFGEISENELIALACAVETRSEHPLAKAIVHYAKSNCIEIPEAQSFQMVTGSGVQAMVKESIVRCGNKAYLEKNGVLLDDKMQNELKTLQQQGKAEIIVSSNDKSVGIIVLSDSFRGCAKDVVEKLKQMDTEVVLLTGDNRYAAEYFASQTGITNVHSELLPTDKVLKIQQMQEMGKIVCMTGDGVNDAPSLKTADVGIAMGSIGSDVAIEAADIALMGDDIANIPYIKRLSNLTIQTIKANISLAMIINFAAIALSVMGVLNPVTGALVHNAGSVLVVLNAALLYDRKLG